MSKENRISITIPPADLQAVQQALANIQAILAPYVVAMTPEDRKKILKMGDSSEPFVSKVMDYAISDPQFLPPYMQVAEMKKDWEAVVNLLPVFRVLQQLDDNLSDTVMLAGSEAYEAALAYYGSVKMAANMNIPGAKAIYDDLKKRFEGQGRRRPNSES
jgi:hypothetical protein